MPAFMNARCGRSDTGEHDLDGGSVEMLDAGAESREPGGIDGWDVLEVDDHGVDVTFDDGECVEGFLCCTEEQRSCDVIENHAGRQTMDAVVVFAANESCSRDLDHPAHEEQCSEQHADTNRYHHVERDREAEAHEKDERRSEVRCARFSRRILRLTYSTR